jgi:hypothetical protein
MQLQAVEEASRAGRKRRIWRWGDRQAGYSGAGETESKCGDGGAPRSPSSWYIASERKATVIYELISTNRTYILQFTSSERRRVSE